MSEEFINRIRTAQDRTGSDIILMLNPRLQRLPGIIQRYDDPFFPFGRAIIAATQDVVCGYLFDLASYLSLGAASAIALERTVAFVDHHLINILHGPFVGPDYAAAAFDSNFAFSGVTLADARHVEAYQRWKQGAFILRDGSPVEDGVSGYWPEAAVLIAAGQGESIRLRVAGEAVLYAAPTPDFAQKTRERILEMRHG